MTPEKIKHHIAHLQEKHTELDQQIELMEGTGRFEETDINNLKKQRLALRDEIQELKQKLENFS